ncbi:MAG: LysM peptidoglycan-binding domain-containing protein [Patescibacteria group bacterium]|nr:LysM peptidoglycan-binding domain-containing protein [Patescibacteria group bacterium]
MKRFLFAMTMMAMIIFANPALSLESGVYVIQKDDSIYRIATKVFHLNWGQVRTVAKKRNRIFPGQKISLSDLIDISTPKKVRIGRSPFRSKGVNPLSKKQIAKDKKGLMILGLSIAEVDAIIAIHKKAIAEKLQNGFEWGFVGDGDKFGSMSFGDMKIIYNPIVVENKRIKHSARVYSASGKHVWYILRCGNWAIKKKVVPPPPAPPFVDMGELEEAIARKKVKQYEWDWDSTWGGFDERYQDGNKVKGWWQSTVLYPFVFNDEDENEWAFGLTYTNRNWTGETGEIDTFYYDGDVNIWSLAGRFRDSAMDWEIIGRVGLGERKDEGHLVNQWGRYGMTQETDIFNIFSSVEYNKRANAKWFSKTRGSLELEFGFNDEKEDYWTDEWNDRQALDGEPDDKDAFNLALYSDIYNLNQKKSVQIWAEGRSTYYAENYRWGNRIMGGLSFLNGSFKVGPGYTCWNRGHADSDGWYAEVSLYNLYHSIVGYPTDDDWDFEKEIEKGY